MIQLTDFRQNHGSSFWHDCDVMFCGPRRQFWKDSLHFILSNKEVFCWKINTPQRHFVLLITNFKKYFIIIEFQALFHCCLFAGRLRLFMRSVHWMWRHRFMSAHFPTCPSVCVLYYISVSRPMVRECLSTCVYVKHFNGRHLTIFLLWTSVIFKHCRIKTGDWIEWFWGQHAENNSANRT
jgi:hypothetical protein